MTSESFSILVRKSNTMAACCESSMISGICEMMSDFKVAFGAYSTASSNTLVRASGLTMCSSQTNCFKIRRGRLASKFLSRQLQARGMRMCLSLSNKKKRPHTLDHWQEQGEPGERTSKQQPQSLAGDIKGKKAHAKADQVSNVLLKALQKLANQGTIAGVKLG